MKKQNRFFTFFLTMILLVAFFPLRASANGPMPAEWYDIGLSNLPEGTEYVDLLIPLPEDDPMYAELVAENVPAGFSEQSEIITYCVDDFRSYTFHYRDALSVIRAGQGLHVSFGARDEQVFSAENYRYGHLEDIQNRGRIRLAMLDGEGNILQISDVLRVTPRGMFAYLSGSCHYDASTGQWEMTTTTSGFAAVGYVILSICGVIFTCMIERIAAWPFGLGKRYGRLILLTNLVSQVAMRSLYVLLRSLFFWKYADLVIVLEILVYAGEFLYYHLKMTNVSWQRKLLYTAAANTASLVICYRLNQILLFQ